MTSPQTPTLQACRKLEGRKVIIAGGDSGIGRDVCLLFGPSAMALTVVYGTDGFLHLALEGAGLTVTYLPDEEQDAQETSDLIRKKANGRKFQFLPPTRPRKTDVRPSSRSTWITSVVSLILSSATTA